MPRIIITDPEAVCSRESCIVMRRGQQPFSQPGGMLLRETQDSRKDERLVLANGDEWDRVNTLAALR